MTIINKEEAISLLDKAQEIMIVAFLERISSDMRMSFANSVEKHIISEEDWDFFAKHEEHHLIKEFSQSFNVAWKNSQAQMIHFIEIKQ